MLHAKNPALLAELHLQAITASPEAELAKQLVRGTLHDAGHGDLHRRSTARAQTISACVESNPPDTPITSFCVPDALILCSIPATWMLYAS